MLILFGLHSLSLPNIYIVAFALKPYFVCMFAGTALFHQKVPQIRELH